MNRSVITRLKLITLYQMKNTHFPKAGIDFLKKLKRNNRREWFHPKKEIYETLVKAPLQEYIVGLGKALGTKAPEISFDPKKSIYRINRDIRFSPNKDPYKTHIGASMVSRLSKSKDEVPGLYIHIDPAECFIAGGLYMPSAEQMRKIRESIQRDPDSLRTILSNRNFKKYFGGLSGQQLKTAPRGFSPEHPDIDLLRWKQFIVLKPYKVADFTSGDWVKKTTKEFEAMLPLIRWLNKALALW
jgi:uncharacterized protein (TIGR02453 family)